MKHRTALRMSIVGALTSAYWVHLTRTPARVSAGYTPSPRTVQRPLRSWQKAISTGESPTPETETATS